jgi:hypothetical protein
MKLEILSGAAARENMQDYKTILRYLTVATYVRTRKTRVQLQGLHQKMMLLMESLVDARERPDQLQLQSEIDIWMENSVRYVMRLLLRR